MVLKLKKAKALGLSSGGLDSILSALILFRQGIDVRWITFETPFFSAEKAKKAARVTGIPLIVKNITQVYLNMLKNPSVGYGRWMNPCMDCHALMFGLAGSIMEEEGFDFLFSGELLGQRPMSQTRSSLRYVEKHSGFDGYILRPLSAKRLPETFPEKKGLVNREMLLDLAGRSRKPQIELAKEFGITDYPAPGGGCLLTDKGYTHRLKDLFEHHDTCTEKELELLKYGRHFRLNNLTKVIVGRSRGDNEKITKYCNPDAEVLVKTKKIPGPTALLPKKTDKKLFFMAASICIGYSKAPAGTPVDVIIRSNSGHETIKAVGISPEKFKHLMV
ncbi:MAG: tRNA 4-thiouridine(8) synthase ThiI [Deltaproteobacteria bacterium]|nr:MAG: tRNA 4-thiouridine(8) synthase ThiI [Deltaproteobacteria bacterium]